MRPWVKMEELSQMFKAGFQARQELKVFKELPEENQAGEGREALVFEGKPGPNDSFGGRIANYFSCETVSFL